MLLQAVVDLHHNGLIVMQQCKAAATPTQGTVI